MAAEIVGPGVTYERWSLATSAGPLQVSIATVDLSNPNVSLQVATHSDAIVGPGESLSSMADRLHAEVGINADYFDINDTGTPLNVVMSGGRVLHGPDAATALRVGPGNAIAMGPIAYELALSSGSLHLTIAAVNDWSAASDVAELTPEFGAARAFGATEAILTLAAAQATYTVKMVARDLTDLVPLQAGDIAVAAHGTTAIAIATALHAGDSVTIASSADPSLAGVSAAVGGGPLLLRDGQAVSDPAAPAPEETDVRNPVTGAGLSADGNTLWLVVVDGRAPSRSIGLTRPQFASLFAALGAATAMAFDSGGSSEMVVRHLGEPQTAVANVPSDGRERSVADGFFVANVAPVGAPLKLLLDPSRPTPAVLVGSKLTIQAHAVDANDQPVALAPGTVAYSLTPGDAATIDRDGVLVAQRPGPIEISATLGQIAGQLDVTLVGFVDAMKISGADAPLPINGKEQLAVSATTRDGAPIAIDPGAVTWHLDSGSGQISADGSFRAGPTASRDVISAHAGNAVATATMLVGEHAQIFQAVMSPGTMPGQWSYLSRPAGIPGAVDAASAPDGSAALRLAYDFSTTKATRAAYAQTAIALPLAPIALSIEVYGDARGEWLRGGYQNADGNNESVTVARHVDWRGWRTIRVAVPPQAAWPITWTRFYAVEPRRDASERGTLWLRNFTLIYAGPP